MKTFNLALSALLSLAAATPAFGKGKIYTFESDMSGFNTKNFFYDNGQEVVAFDTQFTPELAEKSIAFLRTKTKNPISYVVLTHPNPDKFNGSAVFQKLGAKVIASERTALNIPSVHAYKKYFFLEVAKMFTESTYPEEARVDITFKKKLSLRLGNGEVISLRELSGPGVSTNQTIATVPSLNSLFVGDLIHHRAHAWLEGGIVGGKATPTIESWIQDLKELKKISRKGAKVFGGRGEVQEVRRAVTEQTAYLKKADEVVSKFAKLPGDQTAAIQTALEEAFPEYELGYMIQYGVYGLVEARR